MANLHQHRRYNFDGKVAIVTGSSSGLGEAIVTLLASYGARVTVTGRSVDNVNRVADKCREVSPQQYEANTVVGDITDENTALRLVQTTVDRFGRLDILVNNAGGSSPKGFDDPEQLLQGFDYTFKLNARTPLYLAALAVPHLEKVKGNIINISSIASFSSFNDERLTPYSMSKAALDMFTKCMALTHGKRGIRVNAINPGPFVTNIYRDYSDFCNKQDYLQEAERYKRDSPLGRVGNPAEVGHLVAFLASDDAAYITGASMVIDGGSSINRF